ncbi:hypothetical protein Lal_00024807, partial [Lupinus albus]
HNQNRSFGPTPRILEPNIYSDYLFLTCPCVAALWDWLGNIFATRFDRTSISSILSVCNQQWSPQVKGLLAAALICTINIVWFCSNQSKFENNVQARARIKLPTYLSGNNSMLFANASIHNFTILREFNVALNYNRAPRINEGVWVAPIVGWIKINSDRVALGAPGFAREEITLVLLRVVLQLSRYNIQDSLFVEFQAAIMAIEIAHKKGWNAIWLECDNFMVVDIFNMKGFGS